MWQTAVDILGPDVARILAGGIGLVALVQINTLFLVWLERKVSAHIQLRLGPMEVGPHGILQTLADGIKLIGKELITPSHVDRKLYVLAPIMVFTGVLASLIVIPFSEQLQVRDLDVGVLLIFAFSAFNVLAILMGGWSAERGRGVVRFLSRSSGTASNAFATRLTNPKVTFRWLPDSSRAIAGCEVPTRSASSACVK